MTTYGQETLDPLNAGQWRSAEQQRSGDLNEFFIYQNASQDIPILDDFSIDRTRRLDAQAGDPNVTLTNTFFQLDSAGFSFPNMAYISFPSLRTTFDTISFVDSTVISVDTVPFFQVTVADLSVNPPITMLVEAWLPFDFIDSVTAAGTTTDTIRVTPDLIQDSLFVYEVAADPRTCNCTGTPKPLILWQDDQAFVNNTYPVDPPTLGVATLEGLDSDGFPYDFRPTAFGRADALTTVPINLFFPASDSVYLSFFYQPQGLSGDNVVQAQDSLYLEFYDVVNDEWEQRWSVGYTALQPFEQVMIPIIESEFLQNDFQFRFVNEGSLAGALDHWHLDYVRLGRQRTFDDTVLVDLAYIEEETSLLETYTSVAFDHFISSPTTFMADTIFLEQKNLDLVDKFITYGMRVGLDGTPFSTFDNFPTNGNNISNNASTSFTSAHPINASPNNYTYSSVASDSCAFWKSQFYTNAQPDVNRCNDTVTFVQELSSFYAYDDGTAEAGYNLNVSGAKVAYRYDMTQPDTLRAVRMYFDPIFEDPSNGSFLITIWSDIAPETIIHQNVSFSSPEYTMDGLNRFVEYELDSLVPVPNQFYVGWVQTTNDKMNLGFDLNRNNNDRIFFNVSSVFLPTSFEGSLMMRPVLSRNKDPFLSVNDLSDLSNSLTIFPNPADQFIQFDFGSVDPGRINLSITDATGALIRTEEYRRNDRVTIGDLAPGVYYITLEERSGTRTVRPLVIQR